MAQEAVREDVFVCGYTEAEIALVASVDFSLVRDAAMHNMSGSDLLDHLLRPLRGMLKVHLERDPQRCLMLMGRRLANRVSSAQSCLSWRELLEVAVGSWRERNYHLKVCPFCQRDVRQIRAKLPYYAEFEVR